METSESQKVILVGFGESDDPLPETPQLTRYRVFAGHCLKCGCAGRKLLPFAPNLAIICDACGDRLNTSIDLNDIHEVTYIYWCNRSKFSSDEVQLSDNDARTLEEMVKQFENEYEAPHWAVVVIGGRCGHSDLCVRFDCTYLLKSQ